MRRKKTVIMLIFVTLAVGTGWLISGSALGADPVTNNITVGCDEERDNLVYVLKGRAINVVENGCPTPDQPDLQKNVRARCDQGHLIYTLRTRFGPVDIETVPFSDDCPQPV